MFRFIFVYFFHLFLFYLYRAIFRVVCIFRLSFFFGSEKCEQTAFVHERDEMDEKKQIEQMSKNEYMYKDILYKIQ